LPCFVVSSHILASPSRSFSSSISTCVMPLW
jgi:hypothetical protein